MTVLAADSPSIVVVAGAVVVAGGTIIVFFSILLSSREKWAKDKNALGTVFIGLGTAGVSSELIEHFASHHPPLLCALLGSPVMIALTYCLWSARAVVLQKIRRVEPPRRPRRRA